MALTNGRARRQKEGEGGPPQAGISSIMVLSQRLLGLALLLLGSVGVAGARGISP